VEEEFHDLFKIRSNRTRVEVGNVLIAEPFLQGNYFSRSVIYLVEHDDAGSVGFVLNKCLPYTTSELVEELKGIAFPVYLGGPGERNQLYYLHRREDIPDALQVQEGVFWGGNFKLLVEMLREGEILSEEIRFFAGYSGWTARQLQGELAGHSWMVGKIDRETLFGKAGKELWVNSMRDLGGRHKVWANFPEHPSLN